MLNFKQIIVGFIICGFVACTDNADNAKQANTNNINNANNTTSLKECQNEQDKIQGCVETRQVIVYDSSSNNVWRKTPYKNGKINGIEKYYESGKLDREIPYKNGERDGIEKYYYENGNLWFETPYKNGKKDGIEKKYYKNGNLKSETTYKNGKDENGNLDFESYMETMIIYR